MRARAGGADFTGPRIPAWPPYLPAADTRPNVGRENITLSTTRAYSMEPRAQLGCVGLWVRCFANIVRVGLIPDLREDLMQ